MWTLGASGKLDNVSLRMYWAKICKRCFDSIVTSLLEAYIVIYLNFGSSYRTSLGLERKRLRMTRATINSRDVYQLLNHKNNTEYH